MDYDATPVHLLRIREARYSKFLLQIEPVRDYFAGWLVANEIEVASLARCCKCNDRGDVERLDRFDVCRH
jgi:hypothetical protein